MKTYMITLTEVYGDKDDEQHEIKDAWRIGRGEWRNDRELLDSIQQAISKAIVEGRK